MEFLLEIKFEQQENPVVVHFVTCFNAQNEEVAKSFYEEFLAGLERKNVILFMSNYRRIDHDAILYNRSHDYVKFMHERANAKVDIDVFFLENPNQSKSVAENQVEKFFAGEYSIAHLVKKFHVPVKATDKTTREPIMKEFFYCPIEHIRSL